MHSKLDKVYKQESNPDVRERIFLVRRIVEDKQHIVNVAKELHRCRAWAYKWYKRYNDDDNDGLQGLKDRTRSGRPPDVPKDAMLQIRQELEDSKIGWDFRQVMDLIYNKTGVRNTANSYSCLKTMTTMSSNCQHTYVNWYRLQKA